MRASLSATADHSIRAVLLMQGELSLEALLMKDPDTEALLEIASLCSSCASVQLDIIKVLRPRFGDCSTEQLLGWMKEIGDPRVQYAIVKALNPRVGELKELAGL